MKEKHETVHKTILDGPDSLSVLFHGQFHIFFFHVSYLFYSPNLLSENTKIFFLKKKGSVDSFFSFRKTVEGS